MCTSNLTRLAVATGIACGVTLVSASGVDAQARDGGDTAAERFNTNWLPWLGCWQLWEEQRGLPGDPGTPFDDPAGDDTGAEAGALLGRTLVCVTPAATLGVELTAATGESVLVERTLAADSTRRPVGTPGCEGWEESAWSEDGHRLFTRAMLSCANQPARSVSGVSFLASPSTWTDIQIVDVGGQEHIEIRRYNPVTADRRDELLGSAFWLPVDVDPADIRRARAESAESLGTPDIIEATRRTSPRVVEALLVESRPELDLDADALIALDDAGVSGGVIDLLVALAYPDYFIVERRNRGGAWSGGSGGGSSAWSNAGGFGTAYDPIWYGDLYPYYVTPLGSSYWSRGYNPYLVGGAAGSPFIVVANDADVDDPSTRAIMGRGYTRVRPAEVSISNARGGSSGRQAKRRGSSGSSGDSGGTVASPSGYSRGGSAAPRTAQPRDR
jgi:hypothetical protein